MSVLQMKSDVNGATHQLSEMQTQFQLMCSLQQTYTYTQIVHHINISTNQLAVRISFEGNSILIIY